MSSKDEQEGQGKSTIRIVDRRRFDSSGEEIDEASSANSGSSAQVSSTQVQEIKSTQTNTSTSAPNTAQLESEAERVKEAYNAATANFTMSDSVADGSQQNSQENPDDQAEISFGSFVLSLATQALMQLGQLKAPDGMNIPVDPASAKQSIDILGMLQLKTKGNLDAKEEGLLRDALHSLRLAFLRFR